MCYFNCKLKVVVIQNVMRVLGGHPTFCSQFKLQYRGTSTEVGGLPRTHHMHINIVIEHWKGGLDLGRVKYLIDNLEWSFNTPYNENDESMASSINLPVFWSRL